MTRESILEYAAALKRRYRKASKLREGIILTEFCLTTGYHRKSAIRLLNRKYPVVKGHKYPVLKGHKYPVLKGHKYPVVKGHKHPVLKGRKPRVPRRAVGDVCGSTGMK